MTRSEPSTVILAQDETDLTLFPPLRTGWTRRGQSAPVPISGRNERRMIFGAINLRTGHRLVNVRTQRRVPDFQGFLKHLRRSYPTRQLLLLLDQNPIHTHASSQALAAQLQFALEWLPKRSPHLNAMDHLWRDGKKTICANRQMDSIYDST